MLAVNRRLAAVCRCRGLKRDHRLILIDAGRMADVNRQIDPEAYSLENTKAVQEWIGPPEIGSTTKSAPRSKYLPKIRNLPSINHT
jgi:hypothetical protein